MRGQPPRGGGETLPSLLVLFPESAGAWHGAQDSEDRPWVRVPGGASVAAEGPAWVRACECVCVSVCRSGSTLMHTPTRPHSGSAPSAGENLCGACLVLPKYPVQHHASRKKFPQGPRFD